MESEIEGIIFKFTKLIREENKDSRNSDTLTPFISQQMLKFNIQIEYTFKLISAYKLFCSQY